MYIYYIKTRTRMGKRAQKICDEAIGMDRPKNTELKNSLEYSWASGIHLFSLPKKTPSPFLEFVQWPHSKQVLIR